MITGRDIICLSSIEWNHSWQAAQEIATRLSQAGNRVLYVENTGIRSPNLHDVDRVVRRLKLWTKFWRSHGVQQVASDLYVCSPLVLPPFGSGLRRQINRRLLPSIERAANDLGMRDPVILNFLPTDTAIELLRLLRTPRSVVIYYYVDNFSLLTPHKRRLKRSEKIVMQASDLIFTTCPELAAHCDAWREKVHIFPPGVNLDAFPTEDIKGSQFTPSANGSNGHKPGLEQASPHKKSAAPSLSSATTSKTKPVIGYVGSLHCFVDYSLLVKMAQARPEWKWIYVGAPFTDVSRLAELPNVLLVGKLPHAQLDKYIRSFDVCLIPYMLNEATNTVVPTKLNEYLAVGKPVVSTKLPSLCRFNALHKVVTLSDSEPDKFLQAIECNLQSPFDERAVTRRREVAALADWRTRLEKMSRLIEVRIQAKESRTVTTASAYSKQVLVK